ncbi:putative cytoplasmic protein (plasmid) [Salmonella enterica]|nr:putative cytoplasmic protein [Salmonella enterica]
MTRSRICPDTESTGLSPASDALPVRETTEQFAQVFFGKSVSLLTPEERFTTVYAGSRIYLRICIRRAGFRPTPGFVTNFAPARPMSDVVRAGHCITLQKRNGCAHSIRYGSPRPRPIRENNC